MKSRRRKKAQASFEFISTYAWILLSVLATLGALMYFNVLNPERYMPDECEFGRNIVCQDWSLERNAGGISFDLLLKLKNNLEKPIEMTVR